MTKDKPPPTNPSFFSHETFFEAFVSDLKAAKALALINSAYIGSTRLESMKSVLKACIRRGVRVCVFLQRPENKGLDAGFADRQAKFESCVQTLLDLDVHVSIRDKVHEKIAIIDEHIAWTGSLNILSHYDTSEQMTRWYDREVALQLLTNHRLDTCDTCSARKSIGPDCFNIESELKIIGSFIATRRRLLGLTQKQLGELTNQTQKTISEVECGYRNIEVATLLRIGAKLGSRFRPMPWHIIPSVDERMM